MASSPFRALLRRQLETLRLRRAQRRTQSSGPNSNGGSKSLKAEDPIPIPNTVAPLPFWQRLGPLTRGAQRYGRAQRKWPWRTQLATTLFIYLCGDISAQRISGNDYDPKRTARSLLIGGVAAIPNYTWFMFLSNHFNYSSRVLSIGTKVLINQICFTPIFNSYFFGSQALLSGDTLEQTVERIKKTVPISMINSVKLWPAVTAFSFTFVPIEYRSLFAGVIAIGWQTYLTYLNRQAEMEEVAELAAIKLGEQVAVDKAPVKATMDPTRPVPLDRRQRIEA